jgi:S1-C subfamily serine protease
MTDALFAINQQLIQLIRRVLPSTVTIEGYSEDLSQDSLGSGWIYAPDLVVTNHHVIEGLVAPITVRPVGRTALSGTIIGSDPENDIALLRVEGLQGNPLELELQTPELGELCVAIGTPHSFRESASLGIVSGLSRQIRKDGVVMEELLQTDASVNPGNSGGPLVNIHGRVLGMNTMGPAETVNLAVPSETLAHIVPELRDHGSVERATIGISIAVTQSEANGVLTQAITVQKVRQSDHDLQKGDVLLEIDGHPVQRRVDVLRAFHRHTIDRSIPVLIERDGQQRTITVTPRKRSGRG